jgi:hypothetical protein
MLRAEVEMELAKLGFWHWRSQGCQTLRV